MTFETLKKMLIKRDAVTGGATEFSTVSRLFCGGVAGLSALTVTYPLHVIRRRMQVIHRGAEVTAEMVKSNPIQASKDVYNKSIMTAMRHVYKTEGMYGAFPSLAAKPPSNQQAHGIACI